MVTRVPGGGIWVPRRLFGITVGQVINIEDCKIGFSVPIELLEPIRKGQTEALRMLKVLKNYSDPSLRAKSDFVQPSYDFGRFC